MEFKCSVDINVPLTTVLALFKDTKYFKEWQSGFFSYEPISGAPFTAGAKAKFTYINGKHKIELVETIQTMNLPTEMIAIYEHKHGVNNLITNFTDLPGQKTKYTTDIGYIKPNGFMPKLMAFLMPGMFKKQNQKWLDQFKAFAEKKYQDR
jgi:uncharacterized membrane protein